MLTNLPRGRFGDARTSLTKEKKGENIFSAKLGKRTDLNLRLWGVAVRSEYILSQSRKTDVTKLSVFLFRDYVRYRILLSEYGEEQIYLLAIPSSLQTVSSSSRHSRNIRPITGSKCSPIDSSIMENTSS